MSNRRVDVLGKEFGRLTVVRVSGKNDAGRIIWECLCTCGNTVFTSGTSLVSGRKKSCGCMVTEMMTTHGMSGTKVYGIWSAMKSRCINEKNKDYFNYGGRGIKVCQRWMKFENFIADMGDRPDGCSLDRIDNASGYEPSNCRWASDVEQANNTRKNVFIDCFGKVMTASQWSRELGINYTTIISRLNKGWSAERILSTENLYQ